MLRTTLFASTAIFLAACNDSSAPSAAQQTGASASTQSEGEFFTFELDGKPMQINPEDISTSFYPSGELKIFAGAYRALSIGLTIPEIEKCPCVVPAGATEPGSIIGQGSVSLQGYPNPSNGLNSWYVGQTGVPAAQAIEITEIGPVQNGGRLISGRFQVRILKTESNGDGPENKDYEISNGRFRVLHEMPGKTGF